MAETFGMILDGRQVPALEGETFPVVNPANTDEVVGLVPRGGREDVRRAVDSALNALENTWWPKIYESRRRGRVLQRFAELVDARKEELARLLTREQGKVLKESIGELDSLINTFDYYSGFGGKLTGTVTYTRDGESVIKVETRKEPIGLCAAILPFNFPVSLYAWKVAPALMAGNAVIIKPASTAPLTDIVLTQMLHEAGVPAGIANLVTGPASSAGEELIRHPAVKKIALTGSTSTGKHIYAAAAVPDTVGSAAVLVEESTPAVVAATVRHLLADDAFRTELVAAGRGVVADHSLARASARSWPMPVFADAEMLPSSLVTSPEAAPPPDIATLTCCCALAALVVACLRKRWACWYK